MYYVELVSPKPLFAILFCSLWLVGTKKMDSFPLLDPLLEFLLGSRRCIQIRVVHILNQLMHLSMLSHWGGGGGGGGGRLGIGGGFDVTSLPVVGTFDHSLSSFDQQ